MRGYNKDFTLKHTHTELTQTDGTQTDRTPLPPSLTQYTPIIIINFDSKRLISYQKKLYKYSIKYP